MRREKVQANKCIILVVCYMATTGPLAQEENVKKYTILERVVQEFSRFPVIVMGDMNGHVGILGEKVNETGRKLIDFFEGNEFENLNVTIGNGLHTWESKEWKAAIDYVLVNHEARQHVREMYVAENEFDIDTDHRMLVLKYKWDEKEVMQKMSTVKEKWCLKAASWEEFDKELGRRVWNKNVNVNHMNKEMAKMLYATPEQIIWKVKCRRFTKKAKWFTREIKKEQMRRKILNKKQRQMRKLFERHRIAEVEWQDAWDEYKAQQKKVKIIIYESKR
ncbi:Endonuclease/exonuclease/phosphatase [Trinorchestia longiramus]|nr:Endonuclease/exonuclease/phosphatase [Trinorchestia longiramus]